MWAGSNTNVLLGWKLLGWTSLMRAEIFVKLSWHSICWYIGASVRVYACVRMCANTTQIQYMSNGAQQNDIILIRMTRMTRNPSRRQEALTYENPWVMKEEWWQPCLAAAVKNCRFKRNSFVFFLIDCAEMLLDDAERSIKKRSSSLPVNRMPHAISTSYLVGAVEEEFRLGAPLTLMKQMNQIADPLALDC